MLSGTVQKLSLMKTQATQRVLETRGGSLWPLIQSGDRLTCVEVSDQALISGDLVVIQEENIRVCHRIIRIESVAGERKFLIKADAHLFPDGWKSSNEVIGKIVAVNGSAVDAFPFRACNMMCYRCSQSQWRIFEMIFLSAFGRLASKIRSRFTKTPVFSNIFSIVLCPGSWVRKRF